MAVYDLVGFTSVESSDLPGVRQQGFKISTAPHSFTPRNRINPLHHIKLLENPSPTISKTAKNQKCLNITSTRISTPLIIPILLPMCGITLRSPTRSLKFWPDYPHLNPRYGTMTSKPGESTRWEIGSYRLRNIAIGLVVSVGVILLVMDQPCFAVEVPELEKHTLGERQDT